MKTLKRIASVVLAFLMIFSSVSILASAKIDDGNNNSFVLTTKFYRETEEGSDEWIETSKAAKGEEIRVRIYMESDFYAGAHVLFWLFPSDFMTFNSTLYTKDRTNPTLFTSKRKGPWIENGVDEDSIPYYYEWAVDLITALAPGESSATDSAQQTLDNGFLTTDDYENKGWLQITNAEMAEAVLLDPTYYTYEISFTVNEDAVGVGTFKTPESVIMTPDKKKGVFYIDRHSSAEDILNPETMMMFKADWTLDQDAYVTTQSIFNFVIDENTTEEMAADIGTVFGDTKAVADPSIGKVFLGWDDAATADVTEKYTSAEINAMEVGYEDMTFNAVYEAAEATYGVKVVEQNPDGTWPTADEIAAMTPDYWETEFDGTTPARLGAVINAGDYAAPAGFKVKNADASVTVDDTDNDILVVELQRETVSVTFDGGSTITGLYGSTQTAPKKTTDAGYSNDGWYTTDAAGNYLDKVAEDGGSFTMPAAATNYTSKIVADKQDLKVNVTYFDTIANKLTTVPVTLEDVTATGNKVEIVSTMPASPVAGTDYILISDITKEAELEHYVYDASSESNNLTGTVGADGLTLTVGYTAKSYSVTFDTTVTGVADKKITTTYGSTITASQLPTEEEMEAAKPGYSFDGWYLDTNDEATKFVVGETKVTGTATYKAKYTANTVYVTYVFTGDEGHGVANPKPDAVPAIYDDAIELPTVTAPEGWTFKWTVGDTAVNYGGGNYRVGTQDVTVTGTWTRNTYTITYYYDNNKVATVFDAPVELKYGDPIPEDLTAAQAGKDFVEWTYEMEDGTVVAPATMPAYNLNAVAVFQDISYTVQFMKYNDIVGDEGATASAFATDSAKYMGVIDTVPNTTEEGYRFTGWKFEDGTSVTFPFNVVFQDEKGAYISVPEVAEGETANWTLVGNAAIAKVYATYAPKEIDVTFDPNGGYYVINGVETTDAQVLKTNFGEEIKKPADNWNLQRDGYTFTMWDPEWVDGQTVEAETVEYMAQWLPNVEYVFAGNAPTSEKEPPTIEGLAMDELIDIPEFTVDGYSYTVSVTSVDDDVFDNGDGTYSMGFSPVTVTYTWTADNDVAYTVNTWFAKVGSAEYEAGKALTLYGTTGDVITLSDDVKTAYTGFEFSKLEAVTPADGTILGDGSSVVNAYFTRKMISVTVTDEDGNEITDENGKPIVDPEVQFGDTIDKPTYEPDSKNPGEEFEKWVDEDGNEIDWTNPVDSEDPIVIVPQYKKIDYKVTYTTAGDVPAGYELPNADFADTTTAHYDDPVAVPAWNNDTVPGYDVTITVAGANGTEGAYTVGEGDVTVTATWSKDQFAVNYVTVGTAPTGYTLPANVTGATIGTAIEIPAWVAQGAPAGYVLGFDVSGAKKLDNGSYEVYNSDVTVTATWTYQKYTVDYVTVGTAPAGYELPADITDAIIGTEFNVPAWDKEAIPGYTVVIKVDNAVLTNGVYSVGTSDVTVTATWTAKQFAIDYVTVGEAPAGYELPADVANVTTGTEVAIPAWATATAPAGYTMKLEVVGAVDGKVYDNNVTVTVTWGYENYTVTYSYDTSAPAAAVVPAVENVHIGQVITLATPAAVTGYEFIGWNVTGATKNADGTYTVGASNITAVGSWKALTGVEYKVQRWFEIIGQDGQYAAESELIKLSGTAGQPATYAATVKGFNLVKVTPADAVIAGDGSTVINAYYDRKTVTVTITDENDNVISTEEVEFGDEIQKPTDPTTDDDGMKFDHWEYEDGTSVETWPIEVTEETPISIKPVFTEKTYTVRFMIDADNVYAFDDLKYKAAIEKPNGVPVKAGYAFVEWRKGSTTGAAWSATDTVPAGNVDYYAYFEARTDITYEIHKYFQGVGTTDWDMSLYEMETVPNATTGSKVTLNLDDYKVAGFTIDAVNSIYKDVEIKGDGSTDLVLYYTRNNVTVNVNGEDVVLPAGDTITKSELEDIIEDTKDKGYNYVEWKDENGNTVTFPYTVPATGGSLTPEVTPKSFTLTFVDKDGNVIETQTVDYKTTITPPDHPTVEGYKPAGWYNVADDTAMPATVPATDATYKAAYTNSTNTAYAITIYMMDLEGNYTIKTTTAAYGTTGDEVRILPESYTGLFEDTTHPDRNLTDTIAADGSTELRIYYARKQFEVTYDGGEAIKVYYGAAIPTVEDPEKVGQKFTGWTDADGKALADYASMPENNLAFTSNWEDVIYTITYVVNGVQTPVEYKYGDKVAEPETPNEPGMTFTGWTPTIPTTMPAEDLIIVAQFGTAYYTVTFLDANGGTFAEYTVMYGQKITVPEETPAKEHHTFVKWSNVPATMPAEDITIAPEFERIPVKLIPMEGSTTVIDRDEMIIYGLKTTLSESILRNQFLDVEGDGYFTITVANGMAGFYGTGAKVELYDNADPSGKPIETYTIIVFGDLNGDARINATDDSMISDELSAADFDALWSYASLPGYDKYKVMAADLNSDGLINATDRSTISNVTLGSEQINQVTKEVIHADA